MEPARPAWVEVNLNAIRENTRSIREHVGPRCGVLSVVKANAYGHGLVPVAQAAATAGAAGLAVALPQEALALREAGLTLPLLVLGSVPPDAADALVAADVTVVIDTLAEGRALAEAARRRGKIARAHVKVDTGMGRRGVLPAQTPELLRQLAGTEGLLVEGIATHFATADEPDDSYLREQAVRFEGCLARLQEEGLRPPSAHAANSAAIVRLPAAYHDLVRPGLLTYGIPPYDGAEALLAVRPAMRLVARIAEVREMPEGAGIGYGCAYRMPAPGRIAILPLGYADGFSRHHSNAGDVLIRGRRAPIRGRVCMDQFLAEVTHLPEARVGDEAVLIGSQGSETISVQEVADRSGTITHEVVAALTERLPRRYIT